MALHESEIGHLARLAYQGGNRKLQQGWWKYVKDRAAKAEIPEAELLKEIEKLKEERAKG